MIWKQKMYNKTNEKEKRRQFLWQNHKKLGERNGIYIEKSQTKIITNIQPEKTRLKLNNHVVWTIVWKWYSVMNQESALVKVVILELLSGTVQTKITAWRKQVNFSSHSWYRVTCHLIQNWGDGYITSTINAHVYIEILNNFFIP